MAGWKPMSEYTRHDNIKVSGEGSVHLSFDAGPIRHIYIFSNGMLAVFDEHDQQVISCQGDLLNILLERKREMEANDER